MRLQICLLLCFCFFFSNAQIDFQTFVLTDDSQSTDIPRDSRGADIDGDGDLDIVSVSFGADKVMWYENLDGLGTFGPQIVIDVLNAGRDIIPADVDGDGDLDLLVMSRAVNGIVWYANLDGQGNFGPQQLVSDVIVEAEKFRVGDMDGDGDLDVVSLDYEFTTDFLRWHENLDGVGTFGPAVVISTLQDRGGGLDVADVDQDGDLDIVAAGIFDEFYLYENQGNAVFSAEQEITDTAGQIENVELADIDGDGDEDIIITQFNPHRIDWYENLDGQGNYSEAQLVTDSADVANFSSTADVDNDMALDILFSSGSGFYWLRNTNGQGSFGPIQTITDRLSIGIRIYGGDFDGNGTVDAVSTASGDDIIGLHRNPGGDGNFSPREAISNSFSTPIFVDGLDVDADGDNDLIYASEGSATIAWLENANGLGNFDTTKKLISVEQRFIQDLAIDDMDGDGDLDIVSAAGDNFVRLGYLENLNGAGDYSVLQTILSDDDTGGVREVHAFDLDGDGDKDLLFCSPAENQVGWVENTDGNGNFGPLLSIGTSVFNIQSTYAADVDNDGDLDVVASSPATDEVYWFENTDGQGTFGPKVLLEELIDAEEIKAADVDNDGDDDLIIASISLLNWLENNGDGTFTRRILSSQDWISTIRLTDMDGDGDPDVLYGLRFDGTVYWIENTDGFGDFSDPMLVAESFEGISGVGHADMDGDGDMDVLSASREEAKLAWHRAALSTNLITGDVGFDTQGDGCDPADGPAPSLFVITERSDGYTQATQTQANGNYQLYVNSGNYTTSLGSIPDYFTSTPDEYQNSFPDVGDVFEGDFCLQADPNINDLRVMIYPSGDARPGFSARYFIVYRNLGTTTLSGTVDFQFDNSKMEFDVANQTPVSQTANSLTFEFSDLQPFRSDWVRLDFTLFPPPTTEIDDILVFESTIFPVAGDANPDDNSAVLEQLVIGSFDPNDIQVVEGEEIFEDEVDNYLHYLIRFQNTGTASAINVRVTNPIEENLDWTTLEVEALSHEGVVEVTDGRQIEFIFDDIDLPPQSETESGSQGFIAYRIKPASNVGLGDSMSNDANIYFDFNPPILTNTVTTTVIDNLDTEVVETAAMLLLPNPANDLVSINSPEDIVRLSVYNYLGQEFLLIEDVGGIKKFSVEELSNGMYFVKLLSDTGTVETIKLLKQ